MRTKSILYDYDKQIMRQFLFCQYDNLYEKIVALCLQTVIIATVAISLTL